jgi:peptidoglycan/xylan/chitin deacetylase (PgdA/CDA1 family)
MRRPGKRLLLGLAAVLVLSLCLPRTTAGAATPMYSFGAYQVGSIPLISARGVVVDGKMLVALTFDDGPSQYTDAILGTLSQKGAHATFFAIGTQINRYPDVARRIVAGGNQLANHTYSHKTLTSCDLATVRYEMKAGQLTIESATGVRTTVVRAPNGAFSAREWNAAGDAISLHVGWDNDPRDWSRPGVSTIVARAITAAESGGIIILHDGGGDRSQTVSALPQIIDGLRARGCELVTVDELLRYALGASPFVPAPNAVYRFYNRVNGSHFYTQSADEAREVIVRWPTVYVYEGIAYCA